MHQRNCNCAYTLLSPFLQLVDDRLLVQGQNYLAAGVESFADFGYLLVELRWFFDRQRKNVGTALVANG